MKRSIIIWPDPLLERPAQAIPMLPTEGTTNLGQWTGQQADDVRRLLDDMVETMIATRGAGLAAPQIGFGLRLAVVKVRVLPAPGAPQQAQTEEIVRLINPEIVSREGVITAKEGCLSFPGYTAEVKRSRWVRVRALDENGCPIELEGDGQLAVALQHELDHLDGVTMATYLSPLKRNVVRASLVKRKRRGLRYVFDAPPAQDFTS